MEEKKKKKPNQFHEKDPSSEELLDQMERGEIPEDPDTNEGREALVDEDAMESWEAGFTQGASGDGQLAKDALTGEPLMGVEDVVELEIDGEIFRFVNEKNAEKFKKRKEKEN